MGHMCRFINLTHRLYDEHSCIRSYTDVEVDGQDMFRARTETRAIYLQQISICARLVERTLPSLISKITLSATN